LLFLHDVIEIVRREILDVGGKGGAFRAAFPIIPHVIHLANRHLFGRFQVTVDRLSYLNDQQCDSAENIGIIILIVGFISACIYLLLVVVLRQRSIAIYRTGLNLLQRLPPTTLAMNKQLTDFVLSRVSQKKRGEMSIAQSAIHISNDAIICTGVSGVIENLNPAVSEITGYTPDQLLGQNVRILFSEDEFIPIDTQRNLMLQSQVSRMFETDMSD
jgi:PAS domain-containing protein